MTEKIVDELPPSDKALALENADLRREVASRDKRIAELEEGNAILRRKLGHVSTDDLEPIGMDEEPDDEEQDDDDVSGY